MMSATNDEREETARTEPAGNNDTSLLCRIRRLSLWEVIDIDREMSVASPCRGFIPTLSIEREAGGGDAGHLREEPGDLLRRGEFLLMKSTMRLIGLLEEHLGGGDSDGCGGEGREDWGAEGNSETSALCGGDI
jgi:hypothetical protein